MVLSFQAIKGMIDSKKDVGIDTFSWELAPLTKGMKQYQ